MKIINAIVVCLLAISFLSCQNKDVKKLKEESTEKAVPEVPKNTSPKVSLNDGQLWEANPETTAGIKALQQIISDSKSDESAAVLKEKLNAEFALIFKNCTMTGAAHDQLHNYLLPLKWKINTIEENNKAALKKEIADYLQEYPLYFK
jgi:hypothetical protein